MQWLFIRVGLLFYPWYLPTGFLVLLTGNCGDFSTTFLLSLLDLTILQRNNDNSPDSDSPTVSLNLLNKENLKKEDCKFIRIISRN